MATIVPPLPDPLGQALQQFGQQFGYTLGDRGIAPLLGGQTSAQRQAAENQKMLQLQDDLAQYQYGQLAPGVQGPQPPLPQVPQFRSPEMQKAALQAVMQQAQTPGQVTQQAATRQAMRHREALHPTEVRQARQNLKAGYQKFRLNEEQFKLIEDELKTGKARRDHIDAQIEHLAEVDKDMRANRKFLKRTRAGDLAYRRWENLRDELAAYQRLYSSTIEYVDDEGNYKFADPTMAAAISKQMVEVIKQIQEVKKDAAEAVGGERKRKGGISVGVTLPEVPGPQQIGPQESNPLGLPISKLKLQGKK